MKTNIKISICLIAIFTISLATSAFSERYYCVYKNGGIVKSFAKSAVDSVKPNAVNLNFYHGGTAISIPMTQVDSLTFKNSNPDLSGEGLANCYVVPTAGDYVFPVKLHDNTELSGDAADYLWTDVEYVWNTADGKTQVTNAVDPMNPEYIIRNIHYNAETHMISFTATGNPGNAVVALYTENAGVRTIVWSWHIWSSGYTLEQMALVGWTSKLLAANSQSMTWLDRSIGAVNTSMDNVGSNGFTYQWGRKDPFIHSRVVGQKTNPSGADETTAFGELTMPVKINSAFGSSFNVNPILATVADGVANPMTLYSPVTTTEYKWASDLTASAWGDGVAPFTKMDLYLKGTDPNKNYTDGIRAGSKSNYDPCPPGYRVPTCEEMWLSFAGAQYTSGTYTAFFNNVTSTMSAITQSHLVQCFGDGCQTTLFPASGHRQDGKLDNLGYAAYYTTSTINPENTSYAFRQLVASNMRVEGSGSFKLPRPIRCVKE